MRRWPALAVLAALTACGQHEQPPEPRPSATQAEPDASAAPAPAALPAPSTSRDPAQVLVGWARAVSLRDWDAVFAYWGEHGEASGMTREQFRSAWGRLKAPDLEIKPGVTEGAAGSSYYTAPVTITDGSRRIAGEVVLRRVNDVPGATPEQLRWHIESSTLQP